MGAGHRRVTPQFLVDANQKTDRGDFLRAVARVLVSARQVRNIVSTETKRASGRKDSPR